MSPFNPRWTGYSERTRRDAAGEWTSPPAGDAADWAHHAERKNRSAPIPSSAYHRRPPAAALLLALAVTTGRAAPDPTWQQLSSKRGDLDLLNKPYHWDAPRVDVWLNNGTGPRPAADGASKTTRYDLTPLHDGQRVLANPHKGW